MKNKTFREERSGQILVITALVISLLIISTTQYFYQLQAENKANEKMPTEMLLAIKVGAFRTVEVSLANITNGGSNTTLEENVNEWIKSLRIRNIYGILVANTSLWNIPPYNSGLLINWSENGYGISSACTNFSFRLLGTKFGVHFDFFANITTTLRVDGYYQIQGGEKNVVLICEVLNEGDPALAKGFEVSYYNGTRWINVEDFSLTNYGNGTYRITFNAIVKSKAVNVSVGVIDTRGIYAQANKTLQRSRKT